MMIRTWLFRENTSLSGMKEAAHINLILTGTPSMYDSHRVLFFKTFSCMPQLYIN